MKKDISKLAVVYARYSSHNQQEQSIEGQIAAAEKYAEAKEYTILRSYCDRAKTGTNDNREEFQRMLSDCAKKQFSIIIVWKVDRFGRNREEITFNKYRAKKHGVRVEYVAENISEGPEGIILESVLEGMAEYYSVQLSQNVRRGKLESAKKHKVMGGWAPLGYRVSKDKEYEIDPDTAPIVKKIFEMYVSGSSIAEIMDYLNGHGYQTNRGKKFDKNNIPRILKNEKYIGTYTYKDIVRDENAIPVIIEKEVFEAAQEMLKTNRRKSAKRWDFEDYILSDNLICGECGGRLHGKGAYGKSGKKYSYYVCQNNCDRKHTCDLPAVRQDFLEDRVLDVVGRILSDDELMEYIANQVWDLYCKDNTGQEERKALESALHRTRTSMENLMRSIEAGLFNDMIRNRMEELQAEEKTLQAQIANLELSSPIRLTRDHILYFLLKFKELNTEDADCRKKLLSTFVNSIFVYRDRMIVTFNYSGDRNRITVDDLKKGIKKGPQPVFDCERFTRASEGVSEHMQAFYIVLNTFAIQTKIPTGR